MQIKSVSTSRSEFSWQKTDFFKDAENIGNTAQSKETPFGHILFFIRQSTNTLSFVLSVCYFGQFYGNIIIRPHKFLPDTHYIKAVSAILFGDFLLKLIEGWFHETHFRGNVPILYPLKTLENQRLLFYSFVKRK